VSVKSGHGVGKTFIAACVVIWFLFTHPDSRVITTAPTSRQVESLLWAEIHSLISNSNVPLGGHATKVKIEIDEKWFALGLSTDDPDRFVGHHAKNLLLVMDEAPGIEPTIYEAAKGILTSIGAKCLLIGNPTTAAGPFFETFKNPKWKNMQISCYDSPAIKDPDKYPGLTTLKWIEERKEDWGEKSPLFLSRVLGEFPIEGEDTLIPLAWCEEAVRRWTKRDDACKLNDRIFFGLDVARYGLNETVLIVAHPNRMLYKKTLHGKDLMEAVGLAVQEAMTHDRFLMQMTIDDTGLGAGVTDRLRELGYPVSPVNFAQKPTDPLRFKGIRDEMYWHLRELFRSGEIAIPDDERLISQLSSIKYKIEDTGKRRIIVETKDQMKKRGQKSPDDSDSLALCMWGIRRFVGSGMYRTRYAGAHEPDDMRYY
jgi:hypothetical protein